ncbi:hypothetical protein TNIN_58781 [Trichonephila inaurata madagascariensis]|uniref:Protein chibby homolog 1 n=1 Tax=Trichonephila inaurata madagascariensis TaxID=2747483 RepID=A0A8X6M974_9ARAC|nr:hypothetical protein TNIN_58781 [Trichonephila inaurata madagascariensis]
MVYRKKTKISKPPIRRSPTQSCFQRHLDPVCSPNEYGLNYGKVELNLGGRKCTFENGNWIIDNHFQRSSTPIKRVDRPSEELQKLVEENNFLKLKVEVLLTLLSELKIKMSNNQKNTKKFKEV